MARTAKKRAKLTNKRRVQAPKRTQPAKEEHPQHRKVSKDKLKRILEGHQKWLRTKDKKAKKGKKANLSRTDLRRAHLRNANLQEADLQEVDLSGANLRHASVQEADLRNASLQGAKLQWADLQGARLREANLRGAKLRGANLQRAHLRHVTGLQEADLQDANLDGATGLLGAEFAGNDITGTTLPKDIHEFKVLQVIEETSKNARKIFLSMLLGCAYSWLTIATTTDARLPTNSASSPLPIIGTEIPIAWFYWAAPFILIALYVYLHFYLQHLWELLAELPAIFPDGKRLDQRAYPWLLNSLVRRHFERLKENRSVMTKLKEWVTIFLAWGVVPLTLLGFWLRYLPRHEWVGTWIHVGLIVASVTTAIVFYRSSARTLRDIEPQSFRWGTSWRDRRTYYGTGIVLVGVALWGLSYGAIEGIRIEAGRFRPDDTAQLSSTDLRWWVPKVFDRLCYNPFLDLVEAEVSTKPENWTGLGDEMQLAVQIARVKKARLSGMNLRYANAQGAFLIRADLEGANLQGADFRGARLQEANLQDTKLEEAVLNHAKLHNADLTEANLRETTLRDANLQNANLRSAYLKGADLGRVNLQGAKLFSAYLEAADLASANLRKADLSNANLQRASLDSADLRDANLQWTNLKSAQLRKANLREANLQQASLFRAELQGADLRDANLQGADLRAAKGVTASQIKQAHNWQLAFYSDDFLKELGLPP